ncbi:hypothetical protein J4Q44_G00343390 [Coregonus suidteri]|uniref:Uncharacterized protein n=1 Tax=Coregonus suidteri TaxID=861788 RepID=A0AAN8QFY3_9TELE
MTGRRVIEYLFEEGVEMGLGSEFCAVGSPYGGGPIQGFACEERHSKIHPALIGGKNITLWLGGKNRSVLQLFSVESMAVCELIVEHLSGPVLLDKPAETPSTPYPHPNPPQSLVLPAPQEPHRVGSQGYCVLGYSLFVTRTKRTDRRLGHRDTRSGSNSNSQQLWSVTSHGSCGVTPTDGRLSTENRQGRCEVRQRIVSLYSCDLDFAYPTEE